MSDGPMTPEPPRPPASQVEKRENLEKGRTHLGVFVYDSLKHLGDHFNAALEEQVREKAEGKLDSWGRGWPHEQIRRWQRNLYYHIGIAQGRGLIDDRTADSLVSLGEDTPGLSRGEVDDYLDNWKGQDKDRVRRRAYPYQITDLAIEVLTSGRNEIKKTGSDDDDDSEAIIKRVGQASLFLRDISGQS